MTDDLDLSDVDDSTTSAEYGGLSPAPKSSVLTQVEEPDGLRAKSFKGVPIAIEWHADGSVTICKELAETIRKTGDTSWLIKPPSNTMYFLNSAADGSYGVAK